MQEIFSLKKVKYIDYLKFCNPFPLNQWPQFENHRLNCRVKKNTVVMEENKIFSVEHVGHRWQKNGSR